MLTTKCGKTRYFVFFLYNDMRFWYYIKGYYRVKGGTAKMPKTVVKEHETIEDALRRFKRDVSRSGTLQEARKREHYLKPSIQKKMRRKANRKNR